MMSTSGRVRYFILLSVLSLSGIVILVKSGFFGHQQLPHPSAAMRRGHWAMPVSVDTVRQPDYPPSSVSMDTSMSVPRNKNVSFPNGRVLRPGVLDAPWVPALWRVLHNFPTKQVNLVLGDNKFRSVVLNWLISALVRCDQPLENVLVLSLDPWFHDLLEQRGIPSVYIDHTSVVKPHAKMSTEHSHIWITRTTVYRLISSWGYDIVTYDSDAIVMKNPKSLFDLYKDKDVIGSAGTYPFPLGKKWGLTVCMGVALYRHTHRTELLWEALSKARKSEFDDQVKLNYALDDCGITWSGSVQSETVEGACASDRLDGLRVAVLSHRAVCRQLPCTPPTYIIHKLSLKEGPAKRRVAEALQLWFLRDDWVTRGDSLKGTRWLEAISNQSHPLVS